MTHSRRIVRQHPTLAARSLPRLIVATLVAGALLLGARAADAAGTPEQQCQATKNKSAGKYGACRQNAEAKLATTAKTAADLLKYDDTLTKCGTKLESAWQKAIDKAAAASVSCPDAPLTEGDFQTILVESTDNIADALAGLGSPIAPPTWRPVLVILVPAPVISARVRPVSRRRRATLEPATAPSRP